MGILHQRNLARNSVARNVDLSFNTEYPAAMDSERTPGRRSRQHHKTKRLDQRELAARPFYRSVQALNLSEEDRRALAAERRRRKEWP